MALLLHYTENVELIWIDEYLASFDELTRRWFQTICSLILTQMSNTVDGNNPAPVEVGSLTHYLQGFIYARWCRISGDFGAHLTTPIYKP